MVPLTDLSVRGREGEGGRIYQSEGGKERARNHTRILVEAREGISPPRWPRLTLSSVSPGSAPPMWTLLDQDQPG